MRVYFITCTYEGNHLVVSFSVTVHNTALSYSMIFQHMIAALSQHIINNQEVYSKLYLLDTMLIFVGWKSVLV